MGIRMKPILAFLDRQALLQIRQEALDSFVNNAVHENENDDAFIARCWVEAFATQLKREKVVACFLKDGKIVCEI
jgi:DNA repair photolyase